MGYLLGTALLAIAASSATSAVEPPISAFAGLPELTDVSISPDGRYLALVGAISGKTSAMVIDLKQSKDSKVVLSSDMDVAELQWCQWANNSRLLCGYRAMVVDGMMVYAATRLAGVDADGRHMKVLVQRSTSFEAQFQDDVIDFTPDDPDTVLVAARDTLMDGRTRVATDAVAIVGQTMETYPSVFALNINNGSLKLVEGSRPGVWNFVTDSQGKVRLSTGLLGTTYTYYARLEEESKWRRLAKTEAFSRDDVLKPVAIAENPNQAYAVGPSNSHDALWKIDLTDQTAPSLVFEHPIADVSPAFDGHHKLLGVRYELDRPFIYYTDPHAAGVIEAFKSVAPDKFNVIVDSTADNTIHVIRSTSDTDPRHVLFV